MQNPEKQVAIVTGASRGLGFEISKVYTQNGINVYMIDINETGNSDAAEVLREMTGKDYPVALKADVSCPEEVKKIYGIILKKEKRVDVLVNNAAIFIRKPFLDTTIEEYRHIFKINSEGPFLMCKEAFKIMSQQNGGKIFNITSTGGFTGYADHSAYVPAKHALQGLTKVLAIEGKAHNIRAIAVCPGGMNTEMGKISAVTLKKDDERKNNLIEPALVADNILYLTRYEGYIDKVVIRTEHGGPFI